MLITRYLDKHEYIRTYRLGLEAFPEDKEFLGELYGGLDSRLHPTGPVSDHSILVTETPSGEIISMVHLKPVTAVYSCRRINLSYICFVATRSDHLREGHMTRLLAIAESRLRQKGDPYCFLVPVDKAIYRSRGYIHDWRFNESERALLYADDGLSECSAKLLATDRFTPPLGLIPKES